MERRFWFVLSLLLVVATVVSACGGAATPAPTVAPAQPPAATTAPAAQPGAQPGAGQSPVATAGSAGQSPVATAGAAAQSPVATAAAGGAPVTLLWGFWGSPQEQASHDRVAAAFMASHPNIKITDLALPYSDYFTKLATLFAGGDPKSIPDVFFLWPTPSYAAKGVLEDLTPYIQKDNYNLNDYWPTLLESASYQGKVYGFPRDMESNVLYYNKALFDAAGVAYPTDKWTWDDFQSAAQKLTKKDANGRVTQYGLAVEGGKWAAWVGSAGGQVLDDLTNPSKCTLDTPQSLKGLTFVSGLYNGGFAMRPAALSQAGGDSGVFQAGQAAMIFQNSSRVADFNAASGLNYDVAPEPVPAGGQRWNINGGAAWVMSSKSAHKAEAWEFLKWLQSNGGGESLYTKNGEIFPALKSVAESPDFMGVAKPANRQAFITDANAAKPGGFGYFPEWDELDGTIIEPGLDSIWAGETPVNQGVTQICQQVNKYLADHGYPKK